MEFDKYFKRCARKHTFLNCYSERVTLKLLMTA